MNGPTQSTFHSLPNSLESAVVVLALLVQQNAFVSLPILMGNVPLSQMRDFDNPFNRIAVMISFLCVAPICLLERRGLADMARTNKLPVLFLGIVVASTLWSIHPDITLRRAAGYFLTVLVSAFLPLRFGLDRAMKLLSLSFAISAIASLVFILVAPQFGIMQEGDLTGSWQGVFCTKELLGSVMAVALFTEMYLLIEHAGHRFWRCLLLLLYGVLLINSRSRTALLTAACYALGACVLVLWRRQRLAGMFALGAIAISLLGLIAVASAEPHLLFEMVGKDSTLTGRTQIWPAVLELIDKKPLLGWGYRAMWQSSDSMTRYVDSVAGFTVPSSHNAFLEIALQLGWTGVATMALMLAAGLHRGARCFLAGYSTLGWFSMLFVIGIVMAGLTTETLGQNQLIEWVMFNFLLFSCGSALLHPPLPQETEAQEPSHSSPNAPVSTVFGMKPPILGESSPS